MDTQNKFSHYFWNQTHTQIPSRQTHSQNSMWPTSPKNHHHHPFSATKSPPRNRCALGLDASPPPIDPWERSVCCQAHVRVLENHKETESTNYKVGLVLGCSLTHKYHHQYQRYHLASKVIQKGVLSKDSPQKQILAWFFGSNESPGPMPS